MIATKVVVKDLTIKIPTGFICHIGRYKKGRLTADMFPVEVILVDQATQQEFTAHLIEALPFQDRIPNIFSYLVEGVKSSVSEPELLERFNVDNVSSLAFYLYEFRP